MAPSQCIFPQTRQEWRELRLKKNDDKGDKQLLTFFSLDGILTDKIAIHRINSTKAVAKRCFGKESVLKNFLKFAGKQLWWYLFCGKVAGLQVYYKVVYIAVVFLLVLWIFSKQFFFKRTAPSDCLRREHNCCFSFRGLPRNFSLKFQFLLFDKFFIFLNCV